MGLNVHSLSADAFSTVFYKSREIVENISI